MKRKLIKQMCREWRDNIWLILSLMVVFTVVWGGLWFIHAEVYGLFLPKGFDCTDVYSLNVRMIEESSPYYEEEGKDGESMRGDFEVLLRRLREHPTVEAVMYHWGALPYNYNFMGNNLTVADDTIPKYYGNMREASPEIVDVIKLKSLTGSTPAQLKEMLRRGELLISDNEDFEEKGYDPISLKGRKVFIGSDTAKLYRIGDVIENVRRNDYEPAWAGTIINPDDSSWGQVAVRVKPGMGKKFEEAFKDNKELRISRNVFLTELESMSDIREANQRSIEINIRQLIVLVSFVLLTIFLGLLGTFWFRIQQRVGEIAIRKICGATRRNILGRVLSEGLLLLLIAAVISSVILWIFVIPGLLEKMGASEWWIKTLWIELIALGLVAAGIVLSLLYPAFRAMNIEPALAVKSE
ncbi:MAG: FtsX-like permease family protein [Muribaculaceae bacterium]|nr:FtsX-like permease family protein [Muribaculaceae bacterium]